VRHRLASTRPAADFAQGFPARIGPYEVLGQVGQGGVGVVFRARHSETGALVALKTVRVRTTAHLSSVRREILALHRLHHPGIVRFLDGGMFEGRPWYAMELLNGITLGQAIGTGYADFSTIPTIVSEREEERTGTRLGARRLLASTAAGKLEELLTLFRLLCAPLAYLHGEGIVHRDIKPGNIFIRPDGTPVLMDFGLVGRWRGALGREILEDTQTFGGTLVYMAPEQMRGEVGDARSDLYALGCTLYEALTGMVPFEDFGASFGAATGELKPVPPSEIVLGVPRGLDELVLRLLAKDPRDRIGHADDVAAALATLGARDWPRAGLPRGRAYLYQPRLVGRSDALDTMLEGVDSSRKLGGLLLLGGESGIGKTSLAAEVSRIAYQREYEVVTSECPAASPGRTERSLPLLPFRPLLRRIVEHCAVGGPEITARVVGPWQKLLSSIEPVFRDLEAREDTLDPPGLPVAAALERLLGALSETIIAFAHESTALLLVIDDIHWADGLSLALLARLGAYETERAAGRLVILGTYRREEKGTWLASLLELPRTLHVELERLGADNVARMVADMLGVTEAPTDLSKFVARESEGNPFFVGEYLRAALDAGLLYRDAEGRWHQDEHGSHRSLPLPHNVRALVERRLAALSAQARALIDVAAVIGHDIQADLLLSINARRLSSRPQSEGELVSELGELCARHLLHEVTRETLAFSHDTVRKVAYDAIAEDERRALHGLVAEAIEASDAERQAPSEHAALLAHHYRSAGDLAKTLDYLEAAGVSALAHSAGTEAAECFREALKLDREAMLGTPAERRARWENQLGRALQGMGDLDAGKHHLERSVALFGWKAARSSLGLVLQTLFGVVVQFAHRLFGRGRVRSEAAARLLDVARAYDHLLQIHYFEAAPLPLLHATLRTLNLAERAGPSPELASAYANTFAGLALSPSLRSLAPAYLGRAERTLEAAPDSAIESYVCLLKGLDHCNMGRWSQGEPWIRRAVLLGDQLGYRRRSEEALAILAYNLGLRGRNDDALETAERVYRSSLRGDPQTRCWSLVARAQSKLALGRVEEACRDLEAASALAQGLGRDERTWVSGLQALAELEAGDVRRATKLADETLAAMRDRPPLVSASGTAYAAIAEVCLRLHAQADDASRAKRLSAAVGACHVLARFARVFPFMRAQAELAAGDLALVRDQTGRARQAFETAVECARASELPSVEKQARERLERLVPSHSRA
jgi:serine/threonine protein kinase/tetratricopeptide (TPR) repeat protein